MEDADVIALIVLGGTAVGFAYSVRLKNEAGRRAIVSGREGLAVRDRWHVDRAVARGRAVGDSWLAEDAVAKAQYTRRLVDRVRRPRNRRVARCSDGRPRDGGR